MSYNSLMGLGSHSPDPDLINHVELSNPSGVNTDRIGSNDITVSNGTAGTDSPAWLPSGIKFNGSTTEGVFNSAITYPKTAADSTFYTFGAWLKPNAGGLVLGSTGTQDRIWSLIDPDEMGVRYAGGNFTPVPAPGLFDGEYHFVSIRAWSPLAAKAYLDGVDLGEPSFEIQAGPNFDLLGSRRTTLNFNGEIAAFVHFSRKVFDADQLELTAGPEPLNLTLPTLTIDSVSYSGNVGTWDNQNNGAMSYDYEIRLVSDDSVVASETGITGPTFGGVGAFDDPGGYYVWVRGYNDGGHDEAEDSTSESVTPQPPSGRIFHPLQQGF